MRLNNNTVSTQVNSLFEKMLPGGINCVNDKQYHLAEVLPKRKALKCDYINANPINSVNIITLDIDRDTDPFDLSPSPNLVVYNKSNCRAHAHYFLETPVHANENSSKAAKAFYNAVHGGLIKHLGADPAYNHTFTKNPFSNKFRPYALHTRPWSLEHLTEYVKPVNKTIIKPNEAVALGRNCHIFDTAREWAYIAIREYKNQSFEHFHNAMLFKCNELNMSIFVPLGTAETAHIAKSIAKWVWANRLELTSFSKQRARAKKLGVIRRDTMASKQSEALNLLSQGLTVPQIAMKLSVHERTIWRYMS